MTSHMLSTWSDEFVSAEYLAQLLDLLAQYGISSQQIVQGTGVPPQRLITPDFSISPKQYEHIIRNTLTLSDDPLLGLELGLRMTISSHGFLGFAAMACETLGQGISMALRYFSVRTQMAELRFRIDCDQVIIQIIRRAALPANFGFVVHSLISTMLTTVRFLTRDHSGLKPHIFLTESPVRPLTEYKSLLACPVTFNHSQNQIVLPVSALQLPVSTADSLARHTAEAECERFLSSANIHSTDITSNIRKILYESRKVLSLQETAELLGLSTRTLNRQLSHMNTSFKTVSEDIRKDKAIQLLLHSALKIEEIAQELGYTDTSNFGRAFKKWMNISPLAFRKSSKIER